MSFLERVIYKGQKTFNNIFLPLIKLNRNIEDTLIISGDPRGGTTWLSEIIMEIPKSVLVWEPLSVPLIGQLNKLNFSHRQYIPGNQSWPEAKRYFSEIFRGNIFNHHLVQKQSYRNLVNPNQTHVKFCRANQLLPWLTKQFDFSYAPIYLVRHPCAVVASQLKQGGWDHISSRFTIPFDKPFPEFYQKHEAFLNSLETKEQVLAATWCLCNSIPLNHPDNNKKWITISYESLVIEGEKQLKRIEDRWGISLPEKAYEKLQKASATTVVGSPISKGDGSQLNYWNSQLTSKQINEIISVVEYFRIDLYNREFMPTKSFTDS